MSTINFLKTKKLFLVVFLMFISPLLPTNIKPMAIVLFCLVLVYTIFSTKNLRFNKTFFFINASLYLLMFFSLIYSENIDYGFKKLETMASLIVFPLMFSIFPQKHLAILKNKKQLLMLAYIVGIVVLNVFFFIYHFGHYKKELLTHYITVTRIAQGGYNIHPIYLSMHIAIALLFSLFLLYKEKRLSRILIILLIDIILMFFMFLLLKKGPIIGLFIATTLFVILNKNKRTLISFIAVLIVCTTLAITNSKLKHKFSELFKIEALSKGEATSTNIRYSLYPYAISAFKESPIIGHGIGDYRDVLINIYKEEPILFREKYNSHNQYLSFMISIGVLGLFVLLTIIGFNFINALRLKNQVLLILLVFYSFVMLSENILEREDGVLYFSFFLCFFSAIFGVTNDKVSNKKSHL